MPRLWSARILILVVIAWNLQAALAFFYKPGAFAPGFELTGIPGQAAVRAIAVLFVMWNVPYLAACWQPRRNILSLKEALAMQLIGLAGETAILLTIAPEHEALRASISRFIAFDGAGLVLLMAALWIARGSERKK